MFADPLSRRERAGVRWRNGAGLINRFVVAAEDALFTLSSERRANPGTHVSSFAYAPLLRPEGISHTLGSGAGASRAA